MTCHKVLVFLRYFAVDTILQVLCSTSMLGERNSRDKNETFERRRRKIQKWITDKVEWRKEDQ
jgi:hypothetical protein